MTIEVRTPADFRRMPWANGRGSTLELYRLEEAGTLLVRLSIADVVEAGAFSPLPGIDRVLTLIEGGGFDLDFGGEAPGVSLLPFAPAVFSGDWPTRATAVRGASKDFNVMTARGRYRAAVSGLKDGSFSIDTVASGLRFIYVHMGTGRIVSGTEAVVVNAGELAILPEAAGTASIDVNSRAILINLKNI